MGWVFPAMSEYLQLCLPYDKISSMRIYIKIKGWYEDPNIPAKTEGKQASRQRRLSY